MQRRVRVDGDLERAECSGRRKLTRESPETPRRLGTGTKVAELRSQDICARNSTRRGVRASANPHRHRPRPPRSGARSTAWGP